MDEIGNYKILRKLGEGGMGEVFLGEDVMLERKAAIKILKPELSQREDILQRFRTEAVALGRLNHPNIATVYTFARNDQHYYMAMEYVQGETLDSIIQKNGKFEWKVAISYVVQALSGLAHAHKLNVIHRDIKPSNIMLNDLNEIKLMDFGIARILERARQTRTGYMLCTLEYSSPEQIKGLEVDARSDIYSLGAVLYEMLTGQMPFQKKTDYELQQAQIKERPQSPRSIVQDIPKILDDVVMKALAKEPNKRFPSALEFSHALTTLINNFDLNNEKAKRNQFSNLKIEKVKLKIPTDLGKIAKVNSKVLSFIKDYPVPVLASILLAFGGFFLVFNSPKQPIEVKTVTAIPQPAEKQSVVITEPVEAKTPEQKVVNLPSSNEPEISIKSDFPALQPSEEFSSDETQHGIAHKQPAELDRTPTKQPVKTKSAVVSKSRTTKKSQNNEKSFERKMIVAKTKKSDPKPFIEYTPKQSAKKDSEQWVIIPGQTVKKY